MTRRAMETGVLYNSDRMRVVLAESAGPRGGRGRPVMQIEFIPRGYRNWRFLALELDQWAELHRAVTSIGKDVT